MEIASLHTIILVPQVVFWLDVCVLCNLGRSGWHTVKIKKLINGVPKTKIANLTWYFTLALFITDYAVVFVDVVRRGVNEGRNVSNTNASEETSIKQYKQRRYNTIESISKLSSIFQKNCIRSLSKVNKLNDSKIIGKQTLVNPLSWHNYKEAALHFRNRFLLEWNGFLLDSFGVRCIAKKINWWGKSV